MEFDLSPSFGFVAGLDLGFKGRLFAKPDKLVPLGDLIRPYMSDLRFDHDVGPVMLIF